MSRNQIYVHAQWSDFNDVAVEERPIHMGRWVARWSALSASPAVGSRRRRNRRRIEHPVFDVWNFTKTGHQWSAGFLFHVGRATRLISVIVIHKNGFDIGHFEAHAFDILLHGFGGICGPCAQHDVALRRRQQKNFSVCVAHEIKIADDLERLGGSRPVRDLPPDFERLRG